MTKWNLFRDTSLIQYLKTLINIFHHKRKKNDHMMLKIQSCKYYSYITVVLDTLCYLSDKT